MRNDKIQRLKENQSTKSKLSNNNSNNLFEEIQNNPKL
jgi:hypothetical protein